jgi:hypothetical protein
MRLYKRSVLAILLICLTSCSPAPVRGKATELTIIFESLETYIVRCSPEEGSPLDIYGKQTEINEKGEKFVWYEVKDPLDPDCYGWTMADFVNLE